MRDDGPRIDSAFRSWVFGGSRTIANAVIGNFSLGVCSCRVAVASSSTWMLRSVLRTWDCRATARTSSGATGPANGAYRLPTGKPAEALVKCSDALRACLGRGG